MVEAKNYESQYTEDRQLAQSAFGSVYEVTHKQDNKKYVARKLKIDPLLDLD